jgi:hypothetical protein
MLLWPVYKSSNVQSFMMLMDNKRYDVTYAYFFVYSCTFCVFLEILKLLVKCVKCCITGRNGVYMLGFTYIFLGPMNQFKTWIMWFYKRMLFGSDKFSLCTLVDIILGAIKFVAYFWWSFYLTIKVYIISFLFWPMFGKNRYKLV